MTGVQVGPLTTAAGLLATTGRRISVRVIALLTLIGARISEVTMVADELRALAATGAIELVWPVRTAVGSS